MNYIESVLHPIVVIMQYFLDFYHANFGSWGVSILFLSVSMSLLLIPLQRLGRKFELKLESRTAIVDAEIAKLDSSLKGELRFNKIEKIFKSHGYHPIQQVWRGASIIVLLPVLISAFILFEQHPDLIGNGFLIIPDLSKPDQLAWGLNILPAIMFLVTLIDAVSRFNENKTALYQFLLLSMLLVALVYNLPSALLIFWIGNNVVSLLVFRGSLLLSLALDKTLSPQ